MSTIQCNPLCKTDSGASASPPKNNLQNVNGGGCASCRQHTCIGEEVEYSTVNYSTYTLLYMHIIAVRPYYIRPHCESASQVEWKLKAAHPTRVPSLLLCRPAYRLALSLHLRLSASWPARAIAAQPASAATVARPVPVSASSTMIARFTCGGRAHSSSSACAHLHTAVADCCCTSPQRSSA